MTGTTEGGNDRERPAGIFRVFLKLGITSFGGPVAHLGFFRQELVAKRKWLSDAAYGDLIALCQFLPGPASSQVGFSLGYIRGGLKGALAAWAGFTLPSAIVMGLAALGLARVDPSASWIHGLKIAAAAVVAHALVAMGPRLCPDIRRVGFAVLAGGMVWFTGQTWMQVAVILVALAAGRMFLPSPDTDPAVEHLEISNTGSRRWLLLYILLLAGLPMLAAAGRSLWVDVADGFYRSGALVFGGGHVVLPLLEAETVARGWLDRDTFLAGYGVAQAIPGPLFTFSAFLGAAIAPGGSPAGGAVLALPSIFLPGMLLVLGALPWWNRLRHRPGIRASLNGANAAVVGLLAAAFIDPVCTAALTGIPSVILAAAAFAALRIARLPPWLVVALCGVIAGVLGL